MPSMIRDPNERRPDRIGKLTRQQYREMVSEAITEVAAERPRQRETIYDLRPVAFMLRDGSEG